MRGFTYLSAFIGGVNMSKKYNRDAFETTNSGNDLHGQGANQQDNTSQSNATKHYDRIHLQHLIQVVICMDKVLINKIVQHNQMRQNITEMNLKK